MCLISWRVLVFEIVSFAASICYHTGTIAPKQERRSPKRTNSVKNLQKKQESSLCTHTITTIKARGLFCRRGIDFNNNNNNDYKNKKKDQTRHWFLDSFLLFLMQLTFEVVHHTLVVCATAAPRHDSNWSIQRLDTILPVDSLFACLLACLFALLRTIQSTLTNKKNTVGIGDLLTKRRSVVRQIRRKSWGVTCHALHQSAQYYIVLLLYKELYTYGGTDRCEATKLHHPGFFCDLTPSQSTAMASPAQARSKDLFSKRTSELHYWRSVHVSHTSSHANCKVRLTLKH